MSLEVSDRKRNLCMPVKMGFPMQKRNSSDLETPRPKGHFSLCCW